MLQLQAGLWRDGASDLQSSMPRVIGEVSVLCKLCGSPEPHLQAVPYVTWATSKACLEVGTVRMLEPARPLGGRELRPALMTSLGLSFPTYVIVGPAW